MSHNYKVFFLSFGVLFWQCWQFSFILLEVFSTLHSCLFNMSLVAQQIIVSQSEYLPSFWSNIPFSTSSTLAVWSEECSILIFLYFGHCHSRTRLLLIFFLPLFFISQPIINIFITPSHRFQIFIDRLQTQWKFPLALPRRLQSVTKVPLGFVMTLLVLPPAVPISWKEDSKVY